MKATIRAEGDQYIISIFGDDGSLCSSYSVSDINEPEEHEVNWLSVVGFVLVAGLLLYLGWELALMP